MTKRIVALTIFCLLGLLAAQATAQSTPAINSPIEDRAGVIPSQQESRLEAELRQHFEKTGVQMAVLIVETTDGEPIEDYSLRVARAWEGGLEGQDRGLLMTLALEDRRSRIEVGYGLEPIISDGYAARILKDLRPALGGEDYAKAVSLAFDRIHARTHHLDADEELSFADQMNFHSVLVWYWVFLFLGAGVMGGSYWMAREDVGFMKGTTGVVIGWLGSLAVGALVYLITQTVAPIAYAVTYVVGGLLGICAVLSKRNEWLGMAFWTVVSLPVALCLGAEMRPELPRSTDGALFFMAFFAHGGVSLLLYGWGLMAGRSGGGSTLHHSDSSRSLSSSSSSSFSSSSSSFSGGGGSFGGGGASGSW